MIISVTRNEDQALGKRLAAADIAERFITRASRDIISFFAELEMAGAGLTPRPNLRNHCA